MKTIILATSLFALAIGPSIAAENFSGRVVSEVSEEVQHGGGCRKDSPQGQCCHAGSKPYHCH